MKIIKISKAADNSEWERSNYFIRFLDDSDAFERAVWGEVGDTIELNPLSSVGLSSKDGFRGVHVTSDAEFWIKQLCEDYGRDNSATIIRIFAIKGDVLMEDPQYAIRSEETFSDSFVLVTSRQILRKGIDFEINRIETYERDEDGDGECEEY